MTEQTKKRRRRWIIGITLLIVILFSGNFFRNYWLERLLHREIAKWVNKVSDGFYDVKFNSLDIGFFSGNLKITDLQLYPDSSMVEKLKEEHKLPDQYFSLSIDKFGLSGINLLWLLDYRKLHFRDLSLQNPDIKVYSPSPEFRKINISTAKEKNNNADENAMKTVFEGGGDQIYNYIKPHFDYIKIDEIKLKNANVTYSIQGNRNKDYKLKNFNFLLKNFNIDEHSGNNHQLLYSDNFELVTNKPQTIYESNIFKLNVEEINLNARDSIAFINGMNFATKQPYWDDRYKILGEWVNFGVNKVELSGVNFARVDGKNQLTAKKFLIKSPEIDYSKVISANIKHSSQKTIKDFNDEKQDSLTWSLYDMITPIFGEMNIDTIQLSDADLNFNKTHLETGITDTYKFDDLNVRAEYFNINLKNKKLVFFDYFENLALDVDSLSGHVPSKNNELLVEKLFLDTKKQDFRIENIYLKPILQNKYNNYVWGNIKEIDITGLVYDDGINADSIQVLSPTINFTVNKIPKKNKNTKDETQQENQSLDNILITIAPYIEYVTIGSLKINDGEFIVNDNLGKNRYTLHNLDFLAQDFEINTDVNPMKDYAISWKDYQISFSRFNNLTPDKKYRIKIDRGTFNSTTGDMLFKKLDVYPIQENDSSYIKLNVDYAKLLGFNQKQIKNKNLFFESLILENPTIEVKKGKGEHPKINHQKEKTKHALNALPFERVRFNNLMITNPDIYYYDYEKKNHIKVDIEDILADNFNWELGRSFKLNSMKIQSPYIFSQKEIESEGPENINEEERGQASLKFDDILIGDLDISNPKLILQTPAMSLDAEAEKYTMIRLELNTKERSLFKLDTLKFHNSHIAYQKDESKIRSAKKEKNKPKQKKAEKHHALNLRKLSEILPDYTNETYVDFLDVKNFNLLYEQKENEKKITKQKLNETDFFIKYLRADKSKSKLSVEDFGFKTRNYLTPVDGGFYTLGATYINLDKGNRLLELDSISFVSNFPKFDFAYLQPEHKDWFNLNIETVRLSGIDFDKYLKNEGLVVDSLLVDNVMLQNYKNQKIYTPPKLVPLLYEVFDNAPIDYYVNHLDITRFTVLYQELYKKGFIPGQIAFADMRGSVKGFTNIPQPDRKFYKLDAGGLAFGVAPFTATWTMPIQTATDIFYTTAKIAPFDMRVLNKLIDPMTPAYIKSGKVSDIEFDISATTLGAKVKLKMVYDDLYFVLDKSMEDRKENVFVTKIINDFVIKKYNKEGRHFRLPTDTIVRNPYHSNFNYFWQILMPPSVQVLGISKEKQNFAKKVVNLFKEISQLLPLRKEEAVEKSNDKGE